MKRLRKFSNSWFGIALVTVIIVGEIVAWEVSTRFGVRSHPIVVGFLCVGLVTAITSVLYEGVDIG